MEAKGGGTRPGPPLPRKPGLREAQRVACRRPGRSGYYMRSPQVAGHAGVAGDRPPGGQGVACLGATRGAGAMPCRSVTPGFWEARSVACQRSFCQSWFHPCAALGLLGKEVREERLARRAGAATLESRLGTARGPMVACDGLSEARRVACMGSPCAALRLLGKGSSPGGPVSPPGFPEALRLPVGPSRGGRCLPGSAHAALWLLGVGTAPASRNGRWRIQSMRGKWRRPKARPPAGRACATLHQRARPSGFPAESRSMSRTVRRCLSLPRWSLQLYTQKKGGGAT